MDAPAVYLFNPDSDLALSHEARMRRRGLPRAIYTAKPFAVSMARSLQLLPCWYAEAGSRVLVEGDDAQVADWQRWADGWRMAVTLVNRLPDGPVTYRPWGWNNTIVHRLRRQGAVDPCPDVEAFAAMSSRARTIELHRRLAESGFDTRCEVPLTVCRAGQVEEFVRAHPRGAYLKILYSGSGQGICHVRPDGVDRQDWRQWLDGVLRHDGAVVCEPAYDRVMDLAVEFDSSPSHGVELMGYSVFEVDSHNQWTGTVVDRRETLHALIADRCPDFDDAVRAVTASLTPMVPRDYRGHLGVDMMLYRADDGAVALNPCVEINFRTTMGIVALSMAERYGLRGRLTMQKPGRTGAARPLLPIGEYTTLVPVLQEIT